MSEQRFCDWCHEPIKGKPYHSVRGVARVEYLCSKECADAFDHSRMEEALMGALLWLIAVVDFYLSAFELRPIIRLVGFVLGCVLVVLGAIAISEGRRETK